MFGGEAEEAEEAEEDGENDCGTFSEVCCQKKGEERIKQEAMVKESFEGHYWEKVNDVLRKRVVMV